MKIYRKLNVYDAALDRIRYLFDEFENVIVSFSGGKDSTVTLELALIVARERNRLPLKVLFLDQEAEWQATIDLVEEVMARPEVEPLWYQIPIKIFNATSTIDQWLMCWEPGKEKQWVREQSPISIKENTFGTDRFVEFFENYLEVMYPNSDAIFLAGVRCEESPVRELGLTHYPTYKHITWGKAINKKKKHFNFYPLYDWSYTDIWKAIHDRQWKYCTLYDSMYQYGVPIQNMRVSNVHHETAVGSLFILQEIEQQTYNRITQRISGIETAAQAGKEDWVPRVLPYMFRDWREYRDYLLEHLIQPEQQPIFRKEFTRLDAKYGEMNSLTELYRAQVTSMIFNDFHFTKLTNWEKKPDVAGWRRMQAGVQHPKNATNKYVKRRPARAHNLQDRP